MTDIELAKEKSNPMHCNGCDESSNPNNDAMMPNISKAHLLPVATAETTAFDFSKGFSSAYFNKTLQHADLQNARERVTKCQNNGVAIKDRLAKLPKLSAGNLVKAGTNRLDNNIYQLMVDRREEKECANKQKLDLIYEEWQKVLTARIEFVNLSEPESTRTTKDLEILLKALRRDKSECMLKKKKGLVNLHHEWKDRKPLSVD